MKMSYLEEMRPDHYPALYEILREHDPTFDADSLDHMIACFQGLEGWVVLSEDGVMVGMVAYSHFQPGLTIIIHGVVDKNWRGRWVTRRNLRTIFEKPYNELDLPRVSGYMVADLNIEQLWPIFKKIGFRLEGCIRKGFRFRGKLHDLYLVGMLREECRWIK